MSPLGFRYHKSTLWKPRFVNVTTKISVIYYVGHPITKTGIQSLGTWLQNQDWHEVLECEDAQKKADTFYAMFDSVSNVCFPIKKKKVHSNDKPWIAPHN